MLLNCSEEQISNNSNETITNQSIANEIIIGQLLSERKTAQEASDIKKELEINFKIAKKLIELKEFAEAKKYFTLYFNQLSGAVIKEKEKIKINRFIQYLYSQAEKFINNKSFDAAETILKLVENQQFNEGLSKEATAKLLALKKIRELPSEPINDLNYDSDEDELDFLRSISPFKESPIRSNNSSPISPKLQLRQSSRSYNTPSPNRLKPVYLRNRLASLSLGQDFRARSGSFSIGQNDKLPTQFRARSGSFSIGQNTSGQDISPSQDRTSLRSKSFGQNIYKTQDIPTAIESALVPQKPILNTYVQPLVLPEINPEIQDNTQEMSKTSREVYSEQERKELEYANAIQENTQQDQCCVIQ